MRKTATVVITDAGRDAGKTFVLREMAATQTEKWALRAFLALARSGVSIPPELASAGWAGIAVLGLRAFGGMAFSDAEPLLDEMFSCVSYAPDAAKPTMVRGVAPPGCVSIGPLSEDDIEEVATRLKLRREVFALHADFSRLATLFPSAAAASETADTPTT